MVLYISESSRLGTSQSDAVLCQTKHYTCIWLEVGTTIGSTTPCQSGPGINANEEVLYNSKSSQTGASPSDAV